MAKKLEKMLGKSVATVAALGMLSGCAGYNVRVNNVDLKPVQYAAAPASVATDASNFVEKRSYCAEHPVVCIVGGVLVVGGVGYAIYDNNRGGSSNHSSSSGGSSGGDGTGGDF